LNQLIIPVHLNRKIDCWIVPEIELKYINNYFLPGYSINDQNLSVQVTGNVIDSPLLLFFPDKPSLKILNEIINRIQKQLDLLNLKLHSFIRTIEDYSRREKLCFKKHQYRPHIVVGINKKELIITFLQLYFQTSKKSHRVVINYSVK
jgi:hypothetical protein